jgi:hypothetical protein
MLPGMSRLFACLLLAAAASSPAADAQTVTLHSGGRNVRIVAGDAAVLPADFPADVTLPQPYTLVQVERIGRVVTLEADTPGDVATVAAQWDARMEADGWRDAKVVPPPTGQARAWVKPGRAAIAWVKPAAAGVRFQLQLRSSD